MNNRYAFVTGANRGLGFELVRSFLKKGVHVFAGEYSAVESFLADLKQDSPNTLSVLSLDITRQDSVVQAKETVLRTTDRIDWLVNNAAILGQTQRTIFDPIDFDEVLSVIALNAVGPLRVTQSFVDLVLASSAKTIVNVSSEAGSVQNNWRDAWFGYSMSKAALNMESAIVQKGIEAKGGRVLVVHPGWLQTYMEGELNRKAPLTAQESAEAIVELCFQTQDRDQFEFRMVDHLGNPIPW